MKKTYIIPAMTVEGALAEQMLAASLNIYNSTVSGDDALVKDNPWDIFGEAAETEE